MKFQIDSPKSSSDWEQIRQICCKTGGPGGTPIPHERWSFFAEYWIGPYQKFWSHNAFVFRNDAGQVKGYIVWASNTMDHQRKVFLKNWMLVLTTLLGRHGNTEDTGKFLRRMFHLDTWPEAVFAGEAWAKLIQTSPAHLHMNLEPSLRGQGLGKVLLGRLEESLCAQGIPGVHLVCGEGPREFYLKNGFQVVADVSIGPKKIRLFMLEKRV